MNLACLLVLVHSPPLFSCYLQSSFRILGLQDSGGWVFTGIGTQPTNSNSILKSPGICLLYSLKATNHELCLCKFAHQVSVCECMCVFAYAGTCMFIQVCVSVCVGGGRSGVCERVDKKKGWYYKSNMLRDSSSHLPLGWIHHNSSWKAALVNLN